MPFAWTKKTEMTILPSADGWTYAGTGAPEATFIIVAGTEIIIDTKSDGTNKSAYYTINPSFNNATGWTVEFRTKTIIRDAGNFPLCVKIEDGVFEAIFDIYSDRIGDYNSGAYYWIDTTADYHIYRIRGKGKNCEIYIDNLLVISTVLQVPTANNLISFGDIDVNMAVNSSCIWDYLYCCNAGAYSPIITRRRSKTPHYKILFYDKNGLKKGELTNKTAQRYINKFDFELNETGCGSFNLVLTKLPSFNILRNDIVDIYLMDTTTKWYSGYIQKIPEAGRTDNIFIFSGYGFIAELDTIVANKSYTLQELSVMATDLLDTYITLKTRILKNVAKIEATTYTANEMNFEYTKVKKAIYDLVSAAQTWVAGVDETKEFFFRARSNVVQVAAVKAVEKHIDQFLPKEDVSGIVNKYYVKCGAIAGGSNYMTTVEDLVSQALYGLREDVITIPTTNNTTDAGQWAQGILILKKDPVFTATVSNIDITFLGEKIEAIGKARIILKAV